MSFKKSIALCTAILALTVLPLSSQAEWKKYELPDLTTAYGGTALAHMPDGRFIFAENGNFYLQGGWYINGYFAYSNTPVTDPSFIAVWDETHASAGRGGWGVSDIDTFDPSSLTSPGFNNIGVSVQNYFGVCRDANSLYTGGADTGSGTEHGIRYVTLDGNANKIIIDAISTYSCGFNQDADGNLYVGDNDDGKVYRFTKAQLDAAIAGAPLDITDGEFMYDFGSGGHIGHIAVDGYGRIWASGWASTGLAVYNPDLDMAFNYTPYFTNADYKASAFTVDDHKYISFMNQANAGQNNSEQVYGFDSAALYANLRQNQDTRFTDAVKTDPAFYTPDGSWVMLDADTHSLVTVEAFGRHFTKPVPGDYDGDGTTDLAVFWPRTGNWYIKSSASGTISMKNWGNKQCKPVPGDYDGDGKCDIAVFHTPSGGWYIHLSATDTLRRNYLGNIYTQPAPADYDGDGKTDIAVYAANGDWYITSSRSGLTKKTQWGNNRTKPVPSDYDGDGKSDIAVYHQDTGNWYIQNSFDDQATVRNWGHVSATPIPADYDGDGMADIAVYHSKSSTCFIRLSSVAGQLKKLSLKSNLSCTPVCSAAGLQLQQ